MTTRTLSILGAPTNLGNRPYESDGTARGTVDGPHRLRQAGLVAKLGAEDLGDVVAAPYRDFVRPKDGVRNQDLVLAHVYAIADALGRRHDFPLLLGGDCSTVLGLLLAMERRGHRPMLVWFDGHDDFNTPKTSETGGVAGMALALPTGRGNTPLARLGANGALLRDEDVIAVGVRDGDFRGAPIRLASTVEEILSALGEREFVIHVDADVLDPRVMPYVDSPEPGGLQPEELASMLGALLPLPGALAMELTIYDPKEDREGHGAALLVDMLSTAFARRARA